ncbi:MAG: phosphatase PAP2 family protein [Thermodesulfobacteriota bacterium]
MIPGLSSDRATASVALDGRAGRARRRRLTQARIALERALTGWPARCVALVAAWAALGFAVAASIGLPLRWPTTELVVRARWMLLLLYAPLALAWVLAAAGRQRPLLGRWRRLLLSPAFFLEAVVALAALHVTVGVLANLKQYLPAINEMLYDSPLWRLDAWLHAGVEPAVAATELAAEHGLLPWLDHAGLLSSAMQLVVPLLFLLAAKLRPLRGRFFFAYCLLWMLGCALFALWPTLGPAFYRPSRFVWLDQAPHAQHLQDALLRDYVAFRTDPSRYAVTLHQGIVALPNLQVGVLALFALAAARWRALSLGLWLSTLVLFAASLALGWHYAVDGYAGALLACVAWLAACCAVPEQRPDRDVAARTLPRRSTVA